MMKIMSRRSKVVTMYSNLETNTLSESHNIVFRPAPLTAQIMWIFITNILPLTTGLNLIKNSK